jgi:hypothetical protein
MKNFKFDTVPLEKVGVRQAWSQEAAEDPTIF